MARYTCEDHGSYCQWEDSGSSYFTGCKIQRCKVCGASRENPRDSRAGQMDRYRKDLERDRRRGGW